MWTHRRTSVRKHVTWRISEALYLYGAAQVDARFNGHIVGSLKEGPLQEQSEEEQHGQHICILQKLLGGNEIDPQQPHLEAQTGRKGGGRWRYRPVLVSVRQESSQGQSQRMNSAGLDLTLESMNFNSN